MLLLHTEHVRLTHACAHKQDENHHDAAGADLVALNSSYKVMENDKVRYMEESKNVIKRQTQVTYTL